MGNLFKMLMHDTSGESKKERSEQVERGYPWACLGAGVIAFALTLLVDPVYTGGDPVLYRYAYDVLGTSTLEHGFFLYSVILSSTEPVYFVLVWISSHLGVPREYFIGISSAMLALLATVLLVRRGAASAIAAIIVSSSFYFLLLYTTTERLKIAVILLIASMLTIQRPKTAVAFAFLATAAHIQVSLLYSSILMVYMSRQLRQAVIDKVLPPNTIGTIIVALIVIAASYFLLGDQIYAKSISYVGLGEQSDLIMVAPFYFLSLFYTRRYVEVTLLFIPIFILTPMIGYGRLNIFSYFIFLYYAVGVRKGLNLGIALTTIYFGYSSYAFVTRIIDFGDPLLVGSQ